MVLRRRWESLPGNVRGALWVLLCAFSLSLQSATIKYLGDSLHSLEITFFRCLFALPLVAWLLAREGGPRFRLSRFPMHLLRSAVGLTTMGCSFYAFTNLPLAEATAYGFTMPLFLLVLGAALLREQVGWRRTSAALVGFAGVLIMLRPGAGAFEVAAVVALVGAFFHACVGIMVKKLAALESPGMIVFWFNVLGTAVFLLPALAVWRTPDGAQLFWLFTTAVTGMVGQLAIIEACKVADITAVAPMEYSKLLFSTALGFALFAEVPDAWSALGALIIIGATLYITRRELRLARERAAAEAAGEQP